MEDLFTKIQNLDSVQVTAAVRNLRIALEYYWQHEVTAEQARQELENLSVTGQAEELREAIVAAGEDPQAMARWGKSLLQYAAQDEYLRTYVEEAVNDALATSVKLIEPASLIILGVVLVLLKWRPKKFKYDKEDGVTIEWEDNDVSAVADLAQVVTKLPS